MTINADHATIRKTTLSEVDDLCALIDSHTFKDDGSGALLPVKPGQIRDIILDKTLGTFLSAVGPSGTVVGCVSVVIYGLPSNYQDSLRELEQRLATGHVKGHFSTQAAPDREVAAIRVAELRSLAVVGGYRGSGLGLRLIDAAKREARTHGFAELYSLVNQRAVSVFERGGFRKAVRPPHKLAVDCAKCPILYHCNEVPVVVDLLHG